MLYLGKLLLHWCPNCNLPVLGGKCGICRGETKQVEITPPGDVRPAFPYDIALINRVSESQFGSPLIKNGGVVVLNKAPFEDRMDEIIFQGRVQAAIRFEAGRGWVLLPRVEGARRLEPERGWVVIDSGAVEAIQRGASVLAPGIIEADPSIEKDDEVIVLTPSGEVSAVGRARMTGREMEEAKRGVAVRTRHHTTEEHEDDDSAGVQATWEDVVQANLEILKEMEAKAHRFIQRVAESTGKPVTVSYSGGKDSLATLLLVRDVLEDFDVLFADTGLELPETLENVERVAREYNLRLKTRSAGDVFWRNWHRFGPPTMEARWCCKTCKLGPLSRLIEENYPGGCLTFIGQRRYESEARAHSEHVWHNPWMGNQIAASPIQNWTALHVWLYLFWKQAPYNILYTLGFERIGCWLCPSSSLSDLQRLKELHPHLWQKLEAHLEEHREKHGLPRVWKELGLWRWQTPPAKLKKKLKIEIKYPCPHEFHMVSGHRPCTQGGVTAEGSFNTPLNLTRIRDTGVLKTLGTPIYLEGAIHLKKGGESLQIFATGTLTARAPNEARARKLLETGERNIRRALNCTACGLCKSHCPQNAIKIRKTLEITGNCTQCQKCAQACPAIKYTGGPAEIRTPDLRRVKATS